MMKVSLISLGCPKNLVDSENILAVLGEKGCILTDSIEEADLIVINTCAFIKDAVKESEEYINKVFSIKKRNKDVKLIVAGCLAQRYPGKFKALKGIDGVVGTGNPGKVVDAVEEVFGGERAFKVSPATFHTKKDLPRLLLTFPYAYLKIAEGCNNFCEYCLIPYLRGRLRSRPVESILQEAKSLENFGVKELILIAQDTTAYGMDLDKKVNLSHLLKKLVRFNFRWLRILYAHPAHIKDSFLDIMAREGKICLYMDIPIQHAHPEILAKMGRPVMDYVRFFKRIRKAIPDVKLRTTFIVGFPGETAAHFNYTVDFLKEIKFDRVGVFTYSREEGTPAYKFSLRVNEEVKKERAEKLMDVQREISRNKLKKLVGQTLKVLVEGKENGFYVGRTEFDAPEIDGVVYIKGKGLTINEFKKVYIEKSDDYDLYGIL